MPFLDIPSGPSTPSSLVLDDSKLAAGRPRLKETPISMPGGDDRQPAKGSLRSELITPVPGFVLKSSLDEEAKVFIASDGSKPSYPKVTKTFINVASHRLIPEPPHADPDLANLDDFWIPAVVGDVGVTVDKAGKTSLVVDVIFHTSVVERAKRESQYKLFLIQVVLEKVEDKFELELSRDYATPKTLSSKGPLVERTVVLPSSQSKPLIVPTSSSSSSSSRPSITPLPSPPTTPAPSSSPLHTTLTYPSKTSFALSIHLPLTSPLPSPSPTQPKATTLHFQPPRTIAFSLSPSISVQKDVGVEGHQVDGSTVEASWVVVDRVVHVKGSFLSRD